MSVPGCDIAIAYGPVNASAVQLVGLEVQIAPAITLAGPKQGPTTHNIGSHPMKRFIRVKIVGIFLIVVPKVPGGLIEGIRCGLHLVLLVVEFPRPHAHIWPLPLRLVLTHIIAAMGQWFTAFKHQYLEAFFRQFFGRPTAADARAHNDGVDLFDANRCAGLGSR